MTDSVERRRVAGTVGVSIAVALALILGAHPAGTTALYSDGVEFVEHISPFWVLIHLLAVLAFLGVPLVLSAWGASARTVAGGMFGDLAARLSVGGVALATLHLAGTDTMSFLGFRETLDQDGAGAAIGADVLLRIHAATLVAFVMGMFVAVPAVLAIAAWFERERGWRLGLPAATAALAFTAVVVTVVEGQWTTVSEMVLFRLAATSFIVWLGITSWLLRRSASDVEPALTA